MFVNQEITDHFPGEFTNFYIIKMMEDFSDAGLTKGDELEVIGKDTDNFLKIVDHQEIVIPKSKTMILKKMIKSIKHKS